MFNQWSALPGFVMRLFVDRLVDGALPVEQGIEKGDGESTLHDVIRELLRQNNNKKKHFFSEEPP